MITSRLRRLPSRQLIITATFFILIHPITQLLAWLEVRNEFSVETDRLTGFRITANPWSTVVQREAAKPPDLDTIPGSQTLGHLLKHGLDGQLHILG
ncbi:hypothetical protein D3C80_1771400 [compost metagenome]